MKKLSPKNTTTFSQVGAFVWKYYKRRPWAVFTVILLLLIQAITELSIAYYMGEMTDAIAETSRANTEAFWIVAHYLFLVALLGTIFHIINKGTHSFYDWYVKCPAMRDCTVDVFKTVQRFSLDWHSNSFSGAVVTKIKRGSNALEKFGDSFYNHFVRTFILMVAIIVFLFTKWSEMGILFTLGSITYIGFSIWVTRKFINESSRDFAQADTHLGAQLADSVTGNMTVKSFAKETYEDKKFSRIAQNWMDKLFNVYLRFNATGIAQNLLMTVIKISLFGLVIWLWSKGQASVGDFVFVVGVYGLLSGYLRHIGDQIREVQRAANDMEELVEYSLTPIQIQDKENAKRIHVKGGGITLDKITFGYPNQKKTVFKNLSLKIAPGEKIALVGHSGSGKSTLIKLIQRFYEVQKGVITIDQQDISEITQKSLRESISLVPQDPILFHRSLEDNISYGVSRKDTKLITEASKKAHAHEFIQKLDQKYKTLVGERGIKLSGGERQRVAIARALLADAPILILDEATSSLDSQSESYIQEALKVLMEGKTTLVIAHRLSTIKHADRILVFDNGRIIEEGSHKELVKKPNGHYRALYEMQAGGFIGD